MGPPEFSWSMSRHDTFDTCARRYFYSYYLSHEDPEVKRLKRLSALPMWAGSVVHETIEEILKTKDAPPSETEQEAIVHAAVHGRMLTDWRDSEAGSPRFRLFEHEYAVPVEQEDKKLAVGTVMRSLRRFFRSDTLRELMAVGRGQWLSVEDLVTYRIGDVPVLLRMDVAYRDPQGRVVIVDWKTGRSEGRFNAVQIAGYAAYAVEAGWTEDPQTIRTELVYLALGKNVVREVDAALIEHARGFVTRSATRMRERLTDPVANLGRLEDFPMIDRPQVCRRCNFRRLCFPRAESGAAEGTLAAAAPAEVPAAG